MESGGRYNMDKEQYDGCSDYIFEEKDEEEESE